MPVWKASTLDVRTAALDMSVSSLDEGSLNQTLEPEHYIGGPVVYKREVRE